MNPWNSSTKRGAALLLAILVAGGLQSPAEGAPTVRLQPAGCQAVEVELESDGPTYAIEFALRYDPAVILFDRVEPVPGFPGTGDRLYSDSIPESACPPGNESAGLLIGWIFSADGSFALPKGTHKLLTIRFKLPPEATPGVCSYLKFAVCLGPSGLPIRNVVTGEGGSSVPLTTVDGKLCPCAPVPFVRGDADADGKITVTDAIFLLGCLFQGAQCPSCFKAADANGDSAGVPGEVGTFDISDPVYLLRFLFIGGGPPPAPYPECGYEEVASPLTCGSFPRCAGR